MSPVELNEYCKRKIKTYTYHKSALKDCNNKERFEELVTDLYADVFEDEDLFLEFESKGMLPKPVFDSFMGLRSYRNEVLEFFKSYKVLHDF